MASQRARITPGAIETAPDKPQFALANAASAKAIANDASVILEANATAASLGISPPADNDADNDTDTIARGYSDCVALLTKHHDHTQHRSLLPDGTIQRRMLNGMERARCEAIGTKQLAGSAHNMALLWQQHSLKGTSSDADRLVHSLVTLTRQVLGIPCPTRDSTTYGTTLQHHLEQHDKQWSALRNAMGNQHQFANIALDIITSLKFDAALSSAPAIKTDDEAPADQETVSANDEETDSDSNLSVSHREEDDLSSTQTDIPALADNTAADAPANRDAPVSSDTEAGTAGHPFNSGTYCVYSTAEDEVVNAADLCSAQEITELRHQLDEQIARHSRVVGKLSGRLQRVLMAQQTRHWSFNLPEGTLDTTRLTRVVTQPFSPLSFKQESNTDFKDTCVTVLVDNSRSMLGKPIAIAAACADLLSQTLERCGVSAEILGFTTTNLHQGEIFRQWQSNNPGDHPGRLNGLRHIIYKAADTPYRRCKPNFAVMLKKDLLKQNIDGESLIWAYNRLLRRPEKRKILIVISDGEPVDTSTMAANRKNYLNDHLQLVIDSIEARKEVDLLAIGIGHDVTKYYRRAMKIMQARDLGRSLLAQLTDLFKNT